MVGCCWVLVMGCCWVLVMGADECWWWDAPGYWYMLVLDDRWWVLVHADMGVLVVGADGCWCMLVWRCWWWELMGAGGGCRGWGLLTLPSPPALFPGCTAQAKEGVEATPLPGSSQSETELQEGGGANVDGKETLPPAPPHPPNPLPRPGRVFGGVTAVTGGACPCDGSGNTPVPKDMSLKGTLVSLVSVRGVTPCPKVISLKGTCVTGVTGGVTLCPRGHVPQQDPCDWCQCLSL